MIITPQVLAGIALAAALSAPVLTDADAPVNVVQAQAATVVPFDDTRVVETLYDDEEEVVIHAVYRIPGSKADQMAKADTQ